MVSKIFLIFLITIKEPQSTIIPPKETNPEYLNTMFLYRWRMALEKTFLQEEKDSIPFDEWELKPSTVRAKELQEKRRAEWRLKEEQNRIKRLEDELKSLKEKSK